LPGLLAIENRDGQTIHLATTANLRRHAIEKLGLGDATDSSTRNTLENSAAHRFLAVTVGSRFEADWAYLQCTRHRLASTYRSLLDRWQSWFVRCDAGQDFPQWVKTTHPQLVDADAAGAVAGPFPDKHAAARYTNRDYVSRVR